MPILSPSLPSIRVIVRGRLNGNQILLIEASEAVVIDTGYSSCVGERCACWRCRSTSEGGR